MDFDLPTDNIGEVTLIGTGGGYGESIVAHLGNNNWITIDSCIDPKTKKSLSLQYLESLGINIKTDLKMIVATHWHDDHILGISQLLSAGENAIFCMARPNDLKKFLRLVGLDHTKLEIQVSNSSTVEFSKCLEIMEKRNPGMRKNAEADKTLLSLALEDNIRSEVISLSPSDFTMQAFDKEISTLITEYGPSSKKIINKTPNEKSVVILLKMGVHRALLGADLEVKKNNNEGWLHILDKSQVIDKKSTLFKISHHGSSNAYHERIWVELLEKNSLSKLTPWNKNKKLPEPEMLKKYVNHTNFLYMTSRISTDKPKSRDRSIEKAIKKLGIKIKEVKFSAGMVRCRINIKDEKDTWHTSLFENAFHVNSEIA